MLWYILSRPQDWEVMIKDLEQQCGRDRVYRIIDELRRFGHIHRNPPTRDDKGRWVWEPYEVYEYPIAPDTDPYPENTDAVTDDPLPENTDAGFEPKPLPALPYTEKPDITHNTDSTDQPNKTTPPVVQDKPKRKRDLMFEAVAYCMNNTGSYVARVVKMLGGNGAKRDGDWYQTYFVKNPVNDPVEVIAFKLWRQDKPIIEVPATWADKFELFRGAPKRGVYMAAAQQRLDLSVSADIVFYKVDWADPAKWPIVPAPDESESDDLAIADAQQIKADIVRKMRGEGSHEQ